MPVGHITNVRVELHSCRRSNMTSILMKIQNRLGALTLTLIPLFALACSGESSPTSPALASLSLQTANVVMNGSVLNGMTISRDHGNGAATRFEATLMGADGRPATGHRVAVRYTRPGGMMMMNSGEFFLYDDGTNGDPIAGDGIYCFEDLRYQYGCGGYGMAVGEYRYEFYGMQPDGTHSNHMTVNVTLR